MAKKYMLISLGWLSVALGTLGAFLPLLPTVPFMLLAGWCFARSSELFHEWLLSHKQFGPILRDWEENGSLTRKVRNRALLTLWSSMFLSMSADWQTLGLHSAGDHRDLFQHLHYYPANSRT
ncbi:MAG: YbaN family protein [Porticoccaceae bacterium]